MSDRPADLGEAFFFFQGNLINIHPHRNHRDWLIDSVNNIELPSYVQTKPSKALFESYKLGWVRIVWDEGGKWQNGKAAHQGNSIYINGIDKYVWRSMRGILNQQPWIGNIDVVVIEYLDIVDEKPKWDRTDIFHCDSLDVQNFDNLYKGRKPNRSLAPADAKVPHYTEEIFNANRRRNIDNDQ